MSRSAESHISFLSDDALFTKIQLAGFGTFQEILLCKSLQKHFFYMSKPHMLKPGAIII